MKVKVPDWRMVLMVMKPSPHSTLTRLQRTQIGVQTNLTLRISIVPSFGALMRVSGLTTSVK